MPEDIDRRMQDEAFGPQRGQSAGTATGVASHVASRVTAAADPARLRRVAGGRTYQGVSVGSRSEEVLWSSASGGDGAAFAALFRLHRDRVFRHVARLLESDADADEVTASAFFELWRRRDDVVVVGGSVLPWLFATATNLSRNRRRGLARYRTLLDQLSREQVHDDPARDALDRVARGRGESALQRALLRLRADDAGLVALVVLEGMSISEEAAAVVGIAPGAARSRLSRARRRLRLEIAEDGGFRWNLKDA